LFLLSGAKMFFFAPQGPTRYPDKREIWHRGVDRRSPVSNFTNFEAEMWEYSPQNCQNFEFWPQICPSWALVCTIFYEILSVCTRL